MVLAARALELALLPHPHLFFLKTHEPLRSDGPHAPAEPRQWGRSGRSVTSAQVRAKVKDPLRCYMQTLADVSQRVDSQLVVVFS